MITNYGPLHCYTVYLFVYISCPVKRILVIFFGSNRYQTGPVLKSGWGSQSFVRSFFCTLYEVLTKLYDLIQWKSSCSHAQRGNYDDFKTTTVI